MKLLRVASLILVFVASYSYSSDLKNGTDTAESQWKQFKVSKILVFFIIRCTITKKVQK